MREKHLVTGANGFIGKALCKELDELGIEVIAVVRMGANPSSLAGLSCTQLIECDLSDMKLLPSLIDCRVDVFYHLAWEGSSGDSLSLTDTQVDNIRWTAYAVESAILLGAKKFVFASSVSSNEIIESFVNDRLMSANTAYGASKYAANLIACRECEANNLTYCEALISNVYGPGENSPRLINSTIRKLLKKDHCSFTSAKQLYDFIYIDDAARAISKIGCRKTHNRTYYIGADVRPLHEYLEVIRDLVAPQESLGIGDLNGEERYIDYSIIDKDAVESDLKFQCETSFEAGICETRDWIINNQ